MSPLESFRNDRRRAGLLLVVGIAFGLVAASCSSAPQPPDPSTTLGSTNPTTTSSTLFPDEGFNPCDDPSSTLLDLDGDGLDEAVVLTESLFTIAVCSGGSVLAFAKVGTAKIVGFVDLDDDGRLEILIGDPTGNTLGAMTLTIRGLERTDLEALRTIDADLAPAEGPFTGTGFECRDIDDDGDKELLLVAYQPAGGLHGVEPGEGDDIVNVQVARVTLDGLVSGASGVDQFEIDYRSAFSRWVDTPRCEPGAAARIDVIQGDEGWARVNIDRQQFAVEASLLLTGIAHGGVSSSYVVVGTELASPLAGPFFTPRTAIWHSTDAHSWTRSTLQDDGLGEIRDVVALADGSGFVAVGRTVELSAASWVSSDGVSWERFEIPSSRPGPGIGGPVMSKVITTPLGLVAVGIEDYAPTDGKGTGEDIDAAVWISTDGRSWDRIEHPALGTPGYQPNQGNEFNAELVGVTYHPGVGIVAVGSAGEPDPIPDFPPQSVAAWVSANGYDWQRIDVNAAVRLRDVASTAEGLVAVGVEGTEASPDADAAVLFSDDGISWTQIEGPFGAVLSSGLQAMNTVVAIEGWGVIALGTDETDNELAGAAAAWWANGIGSANTLVWERVPHNDSVFGTLGESPSASLVDAVWVDGTLVVLAFSGRTVEGVAGSTGCCLIEPSILMWNPTN
jgi:hypothetical protein